MQKRPLEQQKTRHILLIYWQICMYIVYMSYSPSFKWTWRFKVTQGPSDAPATPGRGHIAMCCYESEDSMSSTTSVKASREYAPPPLISPALPPFPVIWIRGVLASSWDTPRVTCRNLSPLWFEEAEKSVRRHYQNSMGFMHPVPPMCTARH